MTQPDYRGDLISGLAETVERAERKALKIIVGVCREDNPRDVDEAYGAGTYERLFPSEDEV